MCTIKRDMHHMRDTHMWKETHNRDLGTLVRTSAPESADAQHTAMHCNALQHKATHCNELQHTAMNCNTLQ